MTEWQISFSQSAHCFPAPLHLVANGELYTRQQLDATDKLVAEVELEQQRASHPRRRDETRSTGYQSPLAESRSANLRINFPLTVSG